MITRNLSPAGPTRLYYSSPSVESGLSSNRIDLVVTVLLQFLVPVSMQTDNPRSLGIGNTV